MCIILELGMFKYNGSIISLTPHMFKLEIDISFLFLWNFLKMNLCFVEKLKVLEHMSC